jgi:hypothetical protein
MRVFLLALICVAIGGTITALALQHFQKPVSEAFASTGTRLSAN